MNDSRAQLAALLFLGLAGAVLWRYAALDGPESIVLIAALAVWLIVFSLAAIGCGAALWRWASGEDLDHPDAWPVAAITGAGLLALFAGALGAFGLLRPSFLLLGLLAAAGVGAWTVRGHLRLGTRPTLPALPLAVLGFAGVVSLLAVATPSPFYDQVHYHLAFPERWLQLGGIEVFERHSYSYMPANMGLLYLYALAGPGVWAAQALHWWMGLVAAWCAYRIARRLGAGAVGATWAAAILAATPAVLLSSTWASADLGVAAFGGAAILMALGAVDREPRRRIGWYVLIGLLCGAAFGCKYLAVATVWLPVAVLVAGSLLLGKPDDRMRRFLLHGGACTLAIVVAILPWVARNTVLTGNPIYPFYAEFFSRFVQTPALDVAVESALGIGGEREGGLWSSLSLRTFDPLGAAGRIGPQWLILLPLWVALLAFVERTRRGWLLAVSVLVGLIGWSRFHQLGRYLVPVLVPAAAGAGLALERMLAASRPEIRRGLVGLLAVVMLWSTQGGISDAIFTRISSTFGRADPSALLERYVTYWPALPIVNETLPEDATLLLVGEPRSLHLDRHVLLEDPFRTPFLLEIATGGADASAMAERLHSIGVTHVLYNEAEAARIARMNDRPSYFPAADPATTGRLQEFLGRCLETVDQAGPVRVYRLDRACGSLARNEDSHSIIAPLPAQHAPTK